MKLSFFLVSKFDILSVALPANILSPNEVIPKSCLKVCLTKSTKLTLLSFQTTIPSQIIFVFVIWNWLWFGSSRIYRVRRRIFSLVGILSRIWIYILIVDCSTILWMLWIRIICSRVYSLSLEWIMSSCWINLRPSIVIAGIVRCGCGLASI